MQLIRTHHVPRGTLRPHERQGAHQGRVLGLILVPAIAALLLPHAPMREDVLLVGLGISLAGMLMYPALRMHRWPRLLESLPVLVAMTGAAVVSEAAGGMASGMAILLLMPMAWLATFGDAADVAAGALLMVTLLATPALQLVWPQLSGPGPWQKVLVWLVYAGLTVAVLRRLALQLSDRADALHDAHARLALCHQALVHDLKGPLGVIESLSSDMASAPGAPDRQQLERFSAIAGHLYELVDDVALLHETNNAGAGMRWLSTDDLLDEVAAQVPACVVERGEFPERIPANPAALARALRNILENAVVHGGGMSRVRVEGQASTARSGETRWWLSFRDSGPGFPPGVDAEALFEPFVQGSNGRGGQAGLGLAIVRACCEAHGGAATAWNDRNGGGVIRISGRAKLCEATSVEVPGSVGAEA